MTEHTDLLLPGTLWDRIRERTDRALGTGALQPIPTECEVVLDEGIDFQVRIAPSLDQKIAEMRAQREKEAAGERFDPFARPEPDLYLGSLTPSHYALLNKFPVLEHHLLIVTWGYEDQQSLLTHPDFTAVDVVLSEIDGLVFYNAGPTAGASQPHKHLQLVPLPLSDGEGRLPVDALLEPERLPENPTRVARLPFPHAACRVDFRSQTSEQLEKVFYELRRELGIWYEDTPYNLLATRHWMMLVPRARERFEGLMINALGFAGGFLVRNRDDLEQLRRIGPMRVLRGVSE
ncbi:MAG: ATP adenylyltransferase family protein [Thiohalorhabdus sp.]|uniref:ATP adenylyltransferase family protein n=1 Tax=Thiohalorhabdus sp. TaxID=3094134 RepID=UPI00397F09C2